MSLQDDYQYPVKPLPPLPEIGDQRYRASNIAVNPVDAFSGGSFPSPFENPNYPGGSNGPGGGGSGPPGMPQGCGASGVIGTLGASDIELPCETPRSLISANVVALEDESGNTLELSCVNGRLVISYAGSKTISIDVADLADGDTAEFREFVNCDGLTWKALATEPA